MNPIAWLIKQDNESVAVRGTCALGRAPGNQVVLIDEKISRRHAIIHPQGDDEFWLVDLGSSNGTYVNHRRVHQPVPLRDGDSIQIGDCELTFRQEGKQRLAADDQVGAVTIMNIKSSACWLLVADVEGSTALARELPPDELPVVMGRWFSACRQILEDHRATINKYLGDGFLAYWPDRPGSDGEVTKGLDGLKNLQGGARPSFRLVLHHGRVLMGGGASLGEESLAGQDVNFVFRMEKLAGSLHSSCLISDAARIRLGSSVPVVEAGRHALAGFEDDFPFFTY